MSNLSTLTVQDVINQLKNQNNAYDYTLHSLLADAVDQQNPLEGSTVITNSSNYFAAVIPSDGACPGTSEVLFTEKNVNAFLEDVYTLCPTESVTISLSGTYDTITWQNLAEEDAVQNDIHSNTINVSQAGTYSVMVEKDGCTQTLEFNVEFAEVPVIKNIEIIDNQQAVIVTNQSNLEYSLDGETWFNSNVFSNLEPGSYTVYVRGENYCGITEQQFSIFDFNNVLTPNGDGVNDVWRVKRFQPDSQENGTVKVYDRYGKILLNKSLDNPILWNGYYNGRRVPTGDYWYTIQLNNQKTYSGHITVKNK